MKAVDIKKLQKPLISFRFKEKQGNKVRTIGMYSKVARGLMARRIIVERIEDPMELQKGETNGYRYNENLSSEKEWVFVRDQSV